MSDNEYQKYLEGAHWKEFRSRVLTSRNRCETCNLSNIWSRFFYGQNLNVHHLTYATIGRETDADVAVLCVTCHAKEHGLPAQELFTRPRTKWQKFTDQFAFPCDGRPYRHISLMQARALGGKR